MPPSKALHLPGAAMLVSRGITVSASWGIYKDLNVGVEQRLKELLDIYRPS